ncbi:MAG: tRNA lysidine(34) synthetase TilS [Candidatus Moranbacteria bacterium]|nr:tRNA lysidine(34) synthetase TilS [Candidatus Moranbacteria bacterium]
MAQFIKTIQNFAFQNDLWKKNSRIVVGVSGGGDSSCLLDVLSKLAPKYDLQIHIAHVNYALRGKDSKDDEIFVRQLAEKYSFPVSIISSKKAQHKENLENSLRKIRYDFFEKLRRDLKFDLVAVAHNQDDQAETVLMRIIRGSGLNGLGAMKAKSGNIIRPLLQTSKVEILAYLKENNLEFRTDKSNTDLKFTRNRIRQGLLPYLEKEFNPSIKKTLSDWSLSVADDYAFIADSAQFFVTSVCKNNKEAKFEAKKFLDLPIAIQRQALRMVFEKLRGDVNDLEEGQIAEMTKLIKSTKSKTKNAVIGGLKISKKSDSIEIFC